jgi:hypothetical protein
LVVPGRPLWPRSRRILSHGRALVRRGHLSLDAMATRRPILRPVSGHHLSPRCRPVVNFPAPDGPPASAIAAGKLGPSVQIRADRPSTSRPTSPRMSEPPGPHMTSLLPSAAGTGGVHRRRARLKRLRQPMPEVSA